MGDIRGELAKDLGRDRRALAAAERQRTPLRELPAQRPESILLVAPLALVAATGEHLLVAFFGGELSVRSVLWRTGALCAFGYAGWAAAWWRYRRENPSATEG